MAVELSRPGKTSVAITDTTYATVAEELMDTYMKRGDGRKVTTSKLRSIYALVANLSARVNAPDEYEPHRQDIQNLKVRMAYEAGREPTVRAFLDATGLLALVDAVSSFEQLTLYCRYAEALVAYFKYFGGKDR